MHVMNDYPRSRPLAGAISALILTAILLALTAPAAGQCAIQRLLPEYAETNDSFGAGLAINGEIALVGAPGDDDYGGNFGATYIYAFDGSEWIGRGRLPVPWMEHVGVFGVTIDMDGDRAIVGAGAGESGPSHAAFIYRYNGESWQKEAYLPASDTFESAYFITPWVAIEGELACVGCCSDDENGSESGAVYVYRLDDDGEEWVEEQQLRPDDGGQGQQFGNSVALAGDMLLIGACGDDEDAGAVYVFRFEPDDDQWHQEAKLVPADAEPYDWFGISIDVSGDRAVIGADGDTLGGQGGAARVYRYEAGHWSEEAVLKPSDGHVGDCFGYSCAIADDLIIVGAFGVDDGGEESVGAMYVFRRDGTSWVEEGRFVNPAGGEYDQFGIRVALGGHGALASAWYGDGPPSNCGAVYSVAFDVGIKFEDASQSLSPIGHGSPQIHTIVSPPLLAEEQVDFHFTASADLAESDQYIDVEINDIQIGTLFETGAGLCADPPDEDTITVPQAFINQLIEDGGDLVIEMTASETVDPEACDGESWIAADVLYYTYGPGDANHNGIPDACECLADFDGDFEVDTADLLFLLGAWGTPDGDVDFDGDTDTADLLLLLGAWGECPEEKAERGRAES